MYDDLYLEMNEWKEAFLHAKEEAKKQRELATSVIRRQNEDYASLRKWVDDLKAENYKLKEELSEKSEVLNDRIKDAIHYKAKCRELKEELEALKEKYKELEELYHDYDSPYERDDDE